MHMHLSTNSEERIRWMDYAAFVGGHRGLLPMGFVLTTWRRYYDFATGTGLSRNFIGHRFVEMILCSTSRFVQTQPADL